MTFVLAYQAPSERVFLARGSWVGNVKITTNRDNAKPFHSWEEAANLRRLIAAPSRWHIIPWHLATRDWAIPTS